MREIKFRVWTGLEMEYRIIAGTLGAFYVEGLDPQDSACLSPFNTKYSEQTPVMQFTGLKDKNGKDIYEGDVIEASIYSDETPSKLEVHWQYGGFFIDYEDSESDQVLIAAFVGTLEVIGNIYETLELLN